MNTKPDTRKLEDSVLAEELRETIDVLRNEYARENHMALQCVEKLEEILENVVDIRLELEERHQVSGSTAFGRAQTRAAGRRDVGVPSRSGRPGSRVQGLTAGGADPQ